MKTKNQPLGFALGRSFYSPNPTVIGAVEKTGSGNTAIRIGTVLEVGTVVQTEPPTVVGEDNGSWEQTGYVVLTPAERLELVSRLAAHASAEELEDMADRVAEAQRVV